MINHLKYDQTSKNSVKKSSDYHMTTTIIYFLIEFYKILKLKTFFFSFYNAKSILLDIINKLLIISGSYKIKNCIVYLSVTLQIKAIYQITFYKFHIILFFFF
jgi:hypothetical protein